MLPQSELRLKSLSNYFGTAYVLIAILIFARSLLLLILRYKATFGDCLQNIAYQAVFFVPFCFIGFALKWVSWHRKEFNAQILATLLKLVILIQFIHMVEIYWFIDVAMSRDSGTSDRKLITFIGAIVHVLSIVAEVRIISYLAESEGRPAGDTIVTYEESEEHVDVLLQNYEHFQSDESLPPTYEECVNGTN